MGKVNDKHNELITKYMKYVEDRKVDVKNAKPYYLDLKNEYREPHLAIYCSFISNLNNISKQGLLLYIYCSLNMSYLTGYFISSIDKIAIDLGYEPRTIKKWMNELEDNMLICSIKLDLETQFFIRPYDTGKYSTNATIINSNDEIPADILTRQYKHWINVHKPQIGIEEKAEPIFHLQNSFIKHLCGKRKLSPGAVKLFIFCGLVMDKKKGYLYRNLITLSKDLEIKKRTVSCWIDELKDKKLIERHQLSINSSSCIHLLPIKRRKQLSKSKI